MNVSKAVLITGCSSGIGWATAEGLVDVGWRVYATARNVEKIAPLAQRGCERHILNWGGGRCA
jgi:NADP-dependent 3-hydroxy acid dehydrogenase YdfG